MTTAGPQHSIEPRPAWWKQALQWLWWAIVIAMLSLAFRLGDGGHEDEDDPHSLHSAE
jgi:hypothetical protein